MKNERENVTKQVCHSLSHFEAILRMISQCFDNLLEIVRLCNYLNSILTNINLQNGGTLLLILKHVAFKLTLC